MKQVPTEHAMYALYGAVTAVAFVFSAEIVAPGASVAHAQRTLALVSEASAQPAAIVRGVVAMEGATGGSTGGGGTGGAGGGGSAGRSSSSSGSTGAQRDNQNTGSYGGSSSSRTGGAGGGGSAGRSTSGSSSSGRSSVSGGVGAARDVSSGSSSSSSRTGGAGGGGSAGRSTGGGTATGSTGAQRDNQNTGSYGGSTGSTNRSDSNSSGGSTGAQRDNQNTGSYGSTNRSDTSASAGRPGGVGNTGSTNRSNINSGTGAVRDYIESLSSRNSTAARGTGALSQNRVTNVSGETLNNMLNGLSAQEQQRARTAIGRVGSQLDPVLDQLDDQSIRSLHPAQLEALESIDAYFDRQFGSVASTFGGTSYNTGATFQTEAAQTLSVPQNVSLSTGQTTYRTTSFNNAAQTQSLNVPSYEGSFTTSANQNTRRVNQGFDAISGGNTGSTGAQRDNQNTGSYGGYASNDLALGGRADSRNPNSNAYGGFDSTSGGMGGADPQLGSASDFGSLAPGWTAEQALANPSGYMLDGYADLTRGVANFFGANIPDPNASAFQKNTPAAGSFSIPSYEGAGSLARNIGDTTGFSNVSMGTLGVPRSRSLPSDANVVTVRSQRITPATEYNPGPTFTGSRPYTEGYTRSIYGGGAGNTFAGYGAGSLTTAKADSPNAFVSAAKAVGNFALAILQNTIGVSPATARPAMDAGTLQGPVTRTVETAEINLVADPMSDAEVLRILKENGNYSVAEFQKIMQKYGYTDVKVDGIIGPQTRSLAASIDAQASRLAANDFPATQIKTRTINEPWALSINPRGVVEVTGLTTTGRQVTLYGSAGGTDLNTTARIVAERKLFEQAQKNLGNQYSMVEYANVTPSANSGVPTNNPSNSVGPTGGLGGSNLNGQTAAAQRPERADIRVGLEYNPREVSPSTNPNFTGGGKMGSASTQTGGAAQPQQTLSGTPRTSEGYVMNSQGQIFNDDGTITQVNQQRSVPTNNPSNSVGPTGGLGGSNLNGPTGAAPRPMSVPTPRRSVEISQTVPPDLRTPVGSLEMVQSEIERREAEAAQNIAQAPANTPTEKVSAAGFVVSMTFGVFGKAVLDAIKTSLRPSTWFRSAEQSPTPKPTEVARSGFDGQPIEGTIAVVETNPASMDASRRIGDVFDLIGEGGADVITASSRTSGVQGTDPGNLKEIVSATEAVRNISLGLSQSGTTRLRDNLLSTPEKLQPPPASFDLTATNYPQGIDSYLSARGNATVASEINTASADAKRTEALAGNTTPLKPGSTNEAAVTELQQSLQKAGFDIVVDGNYGQQTSDALEDVQQVLKELPQLSRFNVQVNGVLDTNTIGALSVLSRQAKTNLNNTVNNALDKGLETDPRVAEAIQRAAAPASNEQRFASSFPARPEMVSDNTFVESQQSGPSRTSGVQGTDAGNLREITQNFATRRESGVQGTAAGNLRDIVRDAQPTAQVDMGGYSFPNFNVPSVSSNPQRVGSIDGAFGDNPYGVVPTGLNLNLGLGSNFDFAFSDPRQRFVETSQIVNYEQQVESTIDAVDIAVANVGDVEKYFEDMNKGLLDKREVLQFQKEYNQTYGATIREDGVVGPETRRAMQTELGTLQSERDRALDAALESQDPRIRSFADVAVAQQVMGLKYISVKEVRGLDSANVRKAQLFLKSTGDYGGPIDGIWGKDSQQALVEFQKNNNFAPTGSFGPKTREAAIERANQIIKQESLNTPSVNFGGSQGFVEARVEPLQYAQSESSFFDKAFGNVLTSDVAPGEGSWSQGLGATQNGFGEPPLASDSFDPSVVPARADNIEIIDRDKVTINPSATPQEEASFFSKAAKAVGDAYTGITSTFIDTTKGKRVAGVPGTRTGKLITENTFGVPNVNIDITQSKLDGTVVFSDLDTDDIDILARVSAKENYLDRNQINGFVDNVLNRVAARSAQFGRPVSIKEILQETGQYTAVLDTRAGRVANMADPSQVMEQMVLDRVLERLSGVPSFVASTEYYGNIKNIMAPGSRASRATKQNFAEMRVVAVAGPGPGKMHTYGQWLGDDVAPSYTMTANNRAVGANAGTLAYSPQALRPAVSGETVVTASIRERQDAVQPAAYTAETGNSSIFSAVLRGTGTEVRELAVPNANVRSPSGKTYNPTANFRDFTDQARTILKTGGRSQELNVITGAIDDGSSVRNAQIQTDPRSTSGGVQVANSVRSSFSQPSAPVSVQTYRVTANGTYPTSVQRPSVSQKPVEQTFVSDLLTRMFTPVQDATQTLKERVREVFTPRMVTTVPITVSSPDNASVQPASARQYTVAKEATLAGNINYRKGSAADIRAVQQKLQDDGYYKGKVDGIYGRLTIEALQKYQRDRNIVSSGRPNTTGYGAFGPKTRAEFNKDFEKIEKVYIGGASI